MPSAVTAEEMPASSPPAAMKTRRSPSFGRTSAKKNELAFAGKRIDAHGRVLGCGAPPAADPPIRIGKGRRSIDGGLRAERLTAGRPDVWQHAVCASSPGRQRSHRGLVDQHLHIVDVEPFEREAHRHLLPAVPGAQVIRSSGLPG